MSGRPDEVVGYAFNADTYCPACIVGALPTGDGEAFDGWAIVPPATMSTEDNLNELAMAFGIDRFDESSFDSGDFPKVIFASDDSHDTCGVCLEAIA